MPTFLPVFTSMTVRASVRSMMIDPPDGQPHLAVEGLVELLVDVEALEHGRLSADGVVVLDALDQLGVHLADVVAHLLEEQLVVDHHAAVLAVELLAHDPHGQVGLASTAGPARGPPRLGLDGAPLRHQPLDVVAQLVLAGPLAPPCAR